MDGRIEGDEVGEVEKQDVVFEDFLCFVEKFRLYLQFTGSY